MLNFNDIKVCIIDVDGTLTDGTYQVSSEGVITKSFYTRDFYAIEQMLRADIDVLILTQSNAKCILQKINSFKQFPEWDKWIKEQILFVKTGVKDKKEFIERMERYIDWSNVAYIGDAENDVECMQKALFTGCPKDAIKSVIDNSNYISDFGGGKGAVYDFCMYILKERKENK